MIFTHLNIKGYTIFQESLNNNYFQVDTEIFNKISFNQYKLWFQDTCNNIDECINKYNGVVCYLDNTEGDNRSENNFILHICDIMNIMSNIHNHKHIDVIVRSTLLHQLDNDNFVLGV